MAPTRKKIDPILLQKRTSPRFHDATTTSVDSHTARTDAVNRDSSAKTAAEKEVRKRQGIFTELDDCKEKRNKVDTCRTPELPAGFFVSSSRLKYSPRSEDIKSDSPEDEALLCTSVSLKRKHEPAKPNVGPHVSAKIQHILRDYTIGNRAMKRATVAGNEPPMKRATIAGEHPPMELAAEKGDLYRRDFSAVGMDNTQIKRPVLGGMLPPKQRTQHMDCNENPPQKSRHTSVSEKSELQARHKGQENGDWIGARDPLLHKSVVTPPCPILPGQDETPREDRKYTHGPHVTEALDS